MKSEDRWNDWKWQQSNSVTDMRQLCGSVIKCGFSMRIPPYYMNLIGSNENCPIRRQAVPSQLELTDKTDDYKKYGIEIKDSLAEERCTMAPYLLHKYLDRVMLEVTNNCFMYCRFCTRKRLTGIENRKNDLTEAYGYIKKNKSIRDVLVSGGDPLTLEDYELEEILSTLRNIDHVEIIRIGTRAPVVMPMRITNNLVQMLRKYHPIWINTHFNHPAEITYESKNACEKIVDAGIPLGNQSVLLKGVNDNLHVYRELCLKLVQMRVFPYYLYQCDLGIGIDHFRTKVQVGLDIIEGLRQNISGFAIPTYVIDAPNGGGKIAINPDNIIEWNKECLKIKNSKGKIYIYPEINSSEQNGT